MFHYGIIVQRPTLLYIGFRCSHRNRPDHIVVVFPSYPNRYQYVSICINSNKGLTVIVCEALLIPLDSNAANL